MNSTLTEPRIAAYRRRGFLVVDDLLDAAELAAWRAAVDAAVAARVAQAGHDGAEDEDYYRNVFTQCVNLWKGDAAVRGLILDSPLGRMAAELAGVDSIRLYHDHALYKPPWGNPTNWHIDNPYDPFYSRAAIMLWVALDDASVQNGCLYFLDGTHLQGDVGVQADLSSANVGGLFRAFPDWGTNDPSVAEVRAGAGIFINGMLAHAAGPNMTSRRRRAFAFLFMPGDSTYNGHPAALPAELAQRLQAGDRLDDDRHLPLLHPRRAS